MAYIPSERIGAALANATVGVWLERLQAGRTALICKVPETAIKAASRGAAVSLRFGEVQTAFARLLCLGMTIQDELEKPLTVQKPTTDSEDIDLLAEVLSSTSTALHFVNELNHPVLSGWCRLEQPSATTAAKCLASCDPWILTPESSQQVSTTALAEALESAMDLFQQHVFDAQTRPTSLGLTCSARIPLTLEWWKAAHTVAVTSTTESDPFTIDDLDEGQKLERLGQVVIDAVYPLNSYRSPLVYHGRTKRELSDLLGFDADWICLVEAKAMSMLDVPSVRRSSERRKANISKDIAKGLGQLGGALKSIRSGTGVFQADGSPLTIPNREAPAHAIVLLSEMYSFVDWTSVAEAVSNASDDEALHALFHVFDLQELVSLARDATSSTVFNDRLIQRWFLVNERGTAYGRVRPRF